MEIDRIVEIENKYFEQRTRIDLDRRAHAEARDAGQRRRCKSVNPNGENARQRRLALQRNVSRREAEVAAELVAVNHAPRHCVGTAEQLRRVSEIAVRERSADRGAGRPLCLDRNGAHPLDAELSGLRAQQRDVAGSAFAKPKIVADQQPARIQPLFEHLMNERLGSKRREARIKALDDGDHDAERAKRFELRAQRR